MTVTQEQPKPDASDRTNLSLLAFLMLALGAARLWINRVHNRRHRSTIFLCFSLLGASILVIDAFALDLDSTTALSTGLAIFVYGVLGWIETEWFWTPPQ